MYNNNPGPWGGDPGDSYRLPFGPPPPHFLNNEYGFAGSNDGIGAFGSRGEPSGGPNLIYPARHHPEQQQQQLMELDRRRIGERDPGTQFGSRDARFDRDFQDERRDRPRRRSRSRSPRSLLSDDQQDEREWDRGKRRSPPVSRSFERGEELREHDRNRNRKSFREDAPSKTIMLRNLPSGCFEAEIRSSLGNQAAGFVDIRVPRNTEGGNRGFGFLEFTDIPTAAKWMDQVQDAVFIGDQRVLARFSESREPFKKRDDLRPNVTAVQMLPADWECARCGCNNFRHRGTCFRCEALRTEAEVMNIPLAEDQVGLSPSNTLLLRSLDTATDENKITHALMAILGNINLKAVKIMKDPRTSQSAGYGFAQFRTVADATEMYHCLMRINPPLTIDCRQVAVSFAKNGLNDQPPQSEGKSFTTLAPRIPYNGQGNDANSGAAVAQLALQQIQKSHMTTSVQNQLSASAHGGLVMPGYQFDMNTGLYFEPTSKMYYDPKTQYFFNPQTQQHLMWNAHTQQYVQVVGQAPPPQLTAPSPVPEVPRVSEEKPRPEDDKKKQADKIVQEMEKWAKAMNQKQPQIAKKQPLQDVKIGAVASVFKDEEGDELAATDLAGSKLSYKSISKPGPSTSSASPPEMLRNPEKHLAEDNLNNTRDMSRSPPDALDSSTIGQHVAAEKKLVDWERFACLLCKRQLQSKDLLQKHTDLSELHLRNLDAWRQEHLTEAEIEEIEARERDSKYRDRAKERRKKHGEVETVQPLKDKAHGKPERAGKKRSADEAQPDESAPAPGLGSGNVGAKLMKAMGWDESKGLGKSKQGIIDPVEARGHSGTSGLGASDGAPDILPSDSYANKVRKTMRQRFHQL